MLIRVLLLVACSRLAASQDQGDAKPNANLDSNAHVDSVPNPKPDLNPDADAQLLNPGNAPIRDPNVQPVNPEHVQNQNLDPRAHIPQRAKRPNSPINVAPHGAGEDRHKAHRAGGDKAWEPPTGEAIYDHEQCRDAIDNYCPKLKDKRADIAVLLCIEGDRKDDQTLTESCEHLLWQAKLNVTKDEKFFSAAKQFCAPELERFTDCVYHAETQQLQAPGASPYEQSQEQGHLVSCLLDHKENMTRHDRCYQFLSRMEIIMFSDFHLVGRMVQQCKDDVEKFGCGRIDITQDHSHSQGSTLDCLMKEMMSERQGHPSKVVGHTINVGCQRELLRIAELQSDDYHMDRPLYFACRDDREQFCSSVQAGDGRVLGCLLTHRLDVKMGHSCAQQLLLKAQVMAQDYKAAHPLVRACGMEIQKYRCVPPSKNPDQNAAYEAHSPHLYLSYVLLCLENAMHMNQPVNGECHAQVFENRRILMSDYRISPEIVLNCAGEIEHLCNNMVEGAGKTIHCLMSAAQKYKQNSFGAKCYQSISHLLKVADVDEDIRVDAVLIRACGRAIDSHCAHTQKNQWEIMGCLLDNVDKDLPDKCTAHLIEVQYFMSRDFNLDINLYQACHKDAMTLCHANKDWHNMDREPQAHGAAPPGANPQDQTPETDGMVLPCLYRHVYQIKEKERPSEQCIAEVRRVMHDRAVSVHLQPEIEDNCIQDLAKFCSVDTQPGKELICLQDHVDQLATICKEKVEEYSEVEGKDPTLNRILTKECKPIMEKYCPEQDTGDMDNMDVMQCLVHNKDQREMTRKCKSFVHHFQILSMKDYKVSHRFERACREDIESNCRDAHDKTAIIMCLSSVRFEYELKGTGKPLSGHCSKQLQIEYLEEQPMLKELDKGFVKACGRDLQKFCENVVEDPLECIRSHKRELERECRIYVFKHEEIQAVDSSMDQVLIRKCRAEIKALCHGIDKNSVVDCLERQVEAKEMTAGCRSVVMRRMVEAAGQIRLNPMLFKGCRQDIEEHCKKDMDKMDQNTAPEEIQDDVITCLRNTYLEKASKVRARCVHEIQKLIYEAEINPELDPLFYKACKPEIGRLCAHEIMNAEEHTGIMECMRARFYESKISDKACLHQMRRHTDEELLDIHVDPGVYESCHRDIKRFCNDIQSGNSRVFQCLLDAMQQTTIEMEPKCRGKLEDRTRLWKAVYKDKESPVNMGQIAALIHASPAKNSFLTILGVMILAIFAFGLCFGRVTKRVRREMKMK